MLKPVEIAGATWAYDFRLLVDIAHDSKTGRPGLKQYAARTRPLFDKIVASWSAGLNSEWLLRNYLALKLVMASTLQFASADHAYEQNLQMAVPYLSYYGMFNAMRANLLTSPRVAWGQKTLSIGHDNARSQYMLELQLLLSPEECKEQEKLAIDAKHGRELMSYRFPASGAPGAGGFYVQRDVAEEFAMLAAELALFNSFCLCAALQRRMEGANPLPAYELDLSVLETGWLHALSSGGDEALFFDDEDFKQFERISRKVKSPMPFIWMIGDGGIESFFGAFVSAVDDEDVFDPDEHWHRLLDLP